MISSQDNKQVKRIIKLTRKSSQRREEQAFVVEGVRVFSDVPDSDVINVFVSDSFKPDKELAKRLERLGAETVRDDVFAKMSDTVNSQGLIAIVKMHEPDAYSLIKPDGTYVVLESIQDPGNLGTIIRSAEGAGVTAVIMSRDTADIYNPKVVRSTMGAIFRQPFFYTDDLSKTVDKLRNKGIKCFAAHLKGEKSFWEEDLTGGCAFLIGNEGNGLSDEITAHADKLIRIPMEGALESLNAAVSTALLSYEAKRQRTFKTLSTALIFSMILGCMSYSAYADTAANLLEGESIGGTVVLSPHAYNGEEIERLGIDEIEEEIPDTESSNLVMANVKSALNVRSEADIESSRVGMIYRDCGGKVLERGEEWSLIESGELIGWASNEYLLFDEEAEELAREVGFVNAFVTENAVYVRSGPYYGADIIGILSQHAIAEVIEEINSSWIKVAFGNDEGYVAKAGVTIKFEVDHGETMAMIKERKRKEAEARLALQRHREAMQSDENVQRLLGALIQCEAGGEPYEGMVAVGAVVMNRVRSAAYPSTVYDVIYASGQFTPAKTGSLTRVYNNGPKQICVQAAIEALNGYTNVGDMTHFRRAGTKEGYIIGHHVFY